MFDFINLLVFLAILFIVFLLSRELVLWYYRINQRVKLESEILNELKAIRVLLYENNTATDNGDPQNSPSSKFRVGELVVQKNSGKQMRISKVMNDLKSYSCKDLGMVSELGIFQETDLMSFKEWEEKNPSLAKKLFKS